MKMSAVRDLSKKRAPDRPQRQLILLSRQAMTVLDAHDADGPAPVNYHSLLTRYIQTRRKPPEAMQALKLLAGHIADNVAYFGGLAKMPEEQTKNIRNDMYLASETLRFLLRSGGPDLSDTERTVLMKYRAALDDATKFIPLWVKIAVAMALGNLRQTQENIQLRDRLGNRLDLRGFFQDLRAQVIHQCGLQPQGALLAAEVQAIFARGSLGLCP